MFCLISPALAVSRALEFGATSFALFISSGRSWTRPPLKEQAVREFRAALLNAPQFHNSGRTSISNESTSSSSSSSSSSPSKSLHKKLGIPEGVPLSPPSPSEKEKKAEKNEQEEWNHPEAKKGYPLILPHGSYLVNMGCPDK